MIFKYSTALIVALLSANAHSAFSQEEEQNDEHCKGDEECNATGEAGAVDKYPIRKYATADILAGLLSPPTTNEVIGDIPAHLQYTVSLDQAGIMFPKTGMSAVDPEAAITFSSGEFATETKWFKRVVSQKFNRCAGGGWSFYYDDIKKIGEEKNIVNTGKEFFKKLREGDPKYCPLAFTWNEDFTKAEISGYMEQRLSPLPDAVSGSILGLTIELLPYWAWKFGISNKGTKKAEKLDEKCCPPKDGNDACKGAGKLGKPNTECETISMACGVVEPQDRKMCAMWERKNIALGFIPISALTGVGGYLAYPIGDKNEEPTGFTQHFVDGLVAVGVNDVFHGED
jgi:hypothetical protein